MFVVNAEFDVDELEYIHGDDGLVAMGDINGTVCEIYISCSEDDSEEIINGLKGG